jgi:hypothetical protein
MRDAIYQTVRSTPRPTLLQDHATAGLELRGSLDRIGAVMQPLPSKARGPSISSAARTENKRCAYAERDIDEISRDRARLAANFLARGSISPGQRPKSWAGWSPTSRLPESTAPCSSRMRPNASISWKPFVAPAWSKLYEARAEGMGRLDRSRFPRLRVASGERPGKITSAESGGLSAHVCSDLFGSTSDGLLRPPDRVRRRS